MSKKTVTIEFTSEEKAEAFMEWMSDAGGEQEYWQALEDAEQPMDNGFDYNWDDKTIKGRE